jgi:hypothetical protein
MNQQYNFIVKRPFAITSVGIYYELIREGNNQENREQFKKSFIKFIVPYMNNHYFTEQHAEKLFLSIQTLENIEVNTWTAMNKCEQEFGFLSEEVVRLYLSMRNYHLINKIDHIHFNATVKVLNKMYKHDEETEENDCSVCGRHGYDYSWPENEKRGKFYYSIPCKLNEPVCQLCVNGDVTTQKLDNEKESISINEMSDAEMAIYLRENDLVKCGNCGNIWDGCAQCNCWSNDIYDEDLHANTEPENYIEDTKPKENVSIRNLPPNRPVPVPLSLQRLNINNNNDEKDNRIIELEKQNKKLVEELLILKQKIEELVQFVKN